MRPTSQVGKGNKALKLAKPVKKAHKVHKAKAKAKAETRAPKAFVCQSFSLFDEHNAVQANHLFIVKKLHWVTPDLYVAREKVLGSVLVSKIWWLMADVTSLFDLPCYMPYS